MRSTGLRKAIEICHQGCYPSTLQGVNEPHDHHHQKPISKSRPSTAAASRHSFTAKTTSFFFPNSQFMDHESLPSLQESFLNFTKAYPKYLDTIRIDQIRSREYNHLLQSNHVCLDYIGVGLFSHSQFQSQSPIASSSTSSSSPQCLDSPFFSISYKSVALKSQLLHGCEGSNLESALKKRVSDFLNVLESDYCMVFTANKSSAFKLVAESYPFRSNKRLLTVYDYQSEAVDTMIKTSEKRGAKVMSAEFKWPRLRIHSTKLRKMIVGKSKKRRKNRGLLVFPLQSRMTGTNYSYQWMSVAQETGWHVLLDACALGPKDMDSFGLNLFHPDFIVCSFYKVFGENPTGFGCLFVKKKSLPTLEDCAGTGIVSLIPAKKDFQMLSEDSSGTDADLELMSVIEHKGNRLGMGSDNLGKEELRTEVDKEEQNAEEMQKKRQNDCDDNSCAGVICRSLDHVDSFGLTRISGRARCLTNWLVNALMKLQHPSDEKRIPLVRIYGPKVTFDRGPAIAFSVYDWKGQKIEPNLVQKLADRSNISLGCGFLQQIWFSDEYEQDKEKVMERRECDEKGDNRRRADYGIKVVTAALGFLANFEDIYRLWAFVARFLDADFVEKERWRYTALNQKTIEV